MQLDLYIQQAKIHWLAFTERCETWLAGHPRLMEAGRIGAIVVAAGIAFVGLFFLAINNGLFGPMPSRAEMAAIRNPVASEIYDVNGQLLGKYYLENRSEVTYDEVPAHFVQALIATEDARYFAHGGIDLEAWGRVAYKTLLKDLDTGGGSTITQQLAKNLWPRRKYRYASLVKNKLREIIIAHRLERMYSKKEILELYLNTVSFSDNVFGIRTAAQRFFQKEPKELTVEESALLVAQLKATNRYNPLIHPETSRERRDLILGLMHRQGYLSAEDVDSLRQVPLCLDYLRLDHNEGLATYFREHLRLELNDLLSNLRQADGDAYNLYTDGLRIHTTIDARLQAHAETAVKEHLSQLQRTFERHLRGRTPWETEETVRLSMYQSGLYRQLARDGYSPEQIDSIFNTPTELTIRKKDGKVEVRKMSPLDSLRYYLSFLNAGFLVADHQNGAVKAWVGGIDHRFFKYDHVKSRRQTGSAFKPVVYAKALQAGMSPCKFIGNYLRTYPEYDDWRPHNATDNYGGRYSLHGGLSRSINTVAVQLIMETTPESVAELAQDLGIQTEVLPVPSIALGTVEANLLEMTNIYATFANKGRRPDMHYLTRVETADGKVIYQRDEEEDQARILTENQAQMMLHMLQNVVDHGTARRLRHRYKMKCDLAGKTGTTQSHADGWFLGLTPRLVGGVWVGGESTGVRFRDMDLGQGSNTALPIWAIFLKKIYRDPRFKEWGTEKFPKLDDELMAEFRCPAYQDDFFPRIELPEPELEEPDRASLSMFSVPTSAKATGN